MLILTEFTHENVIKLLEMVVEKQEVYIIYEYCEGGTLEDRIPLPEKDIQHIFLQMVDALLEAEEKGIIHRDLKPANILFKEKKLKIADWGFSRLLQNGETTSSFIGSPAYMAPEILRGEEYTLKADVWSLGVAIYETLTGSCPWKSNNISSLCHEIKKTKISFPPELNLADFWKNIITEMLSPSPSNRPTCRELKLKFSKSVKIPKSVDQLEQ
jgi:serine/threonine-protein kinase ULK/ATG1